MLRIQMMGAFMIHTDEGTLEHLVARSRKGVSLVEYLILQRKTVSSQRLLREFWPGGRSESPETALKTLVSRTRRMLSEASPGLGGCIVSEKGGYRWQNLPEMEVDALEILRIVETLPTLCEGDKKTALYRRLLALYAGDLFLTGDLNDGMSLSSWLHRAYLDAVYAYIDVLREREAYNEICTVCQRALAIDEMDDGLHMERMKAMVHLNRSRDAAEEYRRVARASRRLFDAEPGEDLQAVYQQAVSAGQQIRFNLDVIRNELMEADRDPQTPFFCDYATFKEIYNIQMRNLERLGTTMSLGVILIGGEEGSIDAVRRESAMAGLMEILRQSLRKGDIVTRFSPSIVAMLLPTVNYSTGNIVMERIEQLFLRQYPRGEVPLFYRISLLGGSPA